VRYGNLGETAPLPDWGGVGGGVRRDGMNFGPYRAGILNCPFFATDILSLRDHPLTGVNDEPCQLPVHLPEFNFQKFNYNKIEVINHVGIQGCS
jgi:hypothetical protein